MTKIKFIIDYIDGTREIAYKSSKAKTRAELEKSMERMGNNLYKINGGLEGRITNVKAKII